MAHFQLEYYVIDLSTTDIPASNITRAICWKWCLSRYMRTQSALTFTVWEKLSLKLIELYYFFWAKNFILLRWNFSRLLKWYFGESSLERNPFLFYYERFLCLRAHTNINFQYYAFHLATHKNVLFYVKKVQHDFARYDDLSLYAWKSRHFAILNLCLLCKKR